jgi:hypothetical protein
MFALTSLNTVQKEKSSNGFVTINQVFQTTRALERSPQTLCLGTRAQLSTQAEACDYQSMRKCASKTRRTISLTLARAYYSLSRS